jgi:acetylornithine deacetylase/succinyl-diaminopimelate desuccinylase-like protein
MTTLTGVPARTAVTLSNADVRWLLQLLATPSVSPLEGGAPRHTADAARVFVDGALERGFDLRRHAAPLADEIDGPHVPATLRQRLAEPGFLEAQPSIVVGLGRRQPEHRRLVINFHLDTVAPHVEPRLEGRTLHGRGAIDNKGPGVAAAVGVAAALAEDPRVGEEIEVLLAAVPGEEGGAMGVLGTRWLVAQGWTGRLMVFAEPTGGAAHDECTASMTARVAVTGEDSTDDHPAHGHNATVALALLSDVIAQDLLPTAERLEAKACIAGLHTGTAHNRVYGEGQLLVNIAYHRSEDADPLAACLEGAVARAGEEARRRYAGIRALRRLLDDWDRLVSLEWLKRGLPALANRDPAMERVLARAGIPRRNAVAEGAAFTCDAIWAGGPGRYVVACGPGTLAGGGAHTPAEHVVLDDLDGYATSIRDLVLRFAQHVRAEESSR